MFRSAFSPLLAIMALLCFSSGASAQNDRFGSIGGARPEVHVLLSAPRLLGLGLRLDFPLAGDGLVEGVNDEFALSLGAEALFWDHSDRDERQWGIWPVAALQWNFLVSRRWSLFPELGVVALLGHRPYGPLVSPFLTFGARWHFSRRNALLLRIGYPSGLQVGITL